MPLELINITIGFVFIVVWILVSRIVVRQHPLKPHRVHGPAPLQGMHANQSAHTHRAKT